MAGWLQRPKAFQLFFSLIFDFYGFQSVVLSGSFVLSIVHGFPGLWVGRVHFLPRYLSVSVFFFLTWCQTWRYWYQRADIAPFLFFEGLPLKHPRQISHGMPIIRFKKGMKAVICHFPVLPRSCNRLAPGIDRAVLLGKEKPTSRQGCGFANPDC